MSSVYGSVHRVLGATLAALGCLWLTGSPAAGSEFSEPWKRADRALVIDAYEYNSIDWHKLVEDERIVGFINKASDGLPPDYYCRGVESEFRLCKALWKRHAVTRELYHTRRTVAKALGLKWGAYHLGRPGNPVEQANNFLDFADPGPDDLIAIDIEDNDPEKWMSLEDAEEFARHIRRRTGRYPILYTNDNTASYIATNKHRYKLLSRLPLWYARYKPEIGSHFPKGNWPGYALWQFATHANCDQKSCPYRVPGTPLDIDVNVAAMSADELREAWPFGGLLGADAEAMASVPVPFPRHAALAGDDVVLQFADVETAAEPPAFAALLAAGKQPAGAGPDLAGVEPDEAGSLTPAELAGVEPADARGHRARVEPTRFLKDDLVKSTDNPADSRVAQAIERGFADAVVTQSVVRTSTLLSAEAPAFLRSKMPVFLLDGPRVPAGDNFLLPAAGPHWSAFAPE